MPHVDTHEAPHRVGRVVVCQGSRFGQEPPAARAGAGAGGHSRCPDAAGARCRTARTPAERAEGGTCSRSACDPVARSLIKNRARQPASSRSITRFLAACAVQDAVGWTVAPRILIRRLACSITASTCSRAPDRVTVSKKSQASRTSAWERRKSAHVAELRSGAGSIPASCRISQTVEAATFTPSTSSSPCTRRYPHAGFSRTRRSTRTRIERTVRGRPGCRAGTAGRADVLPHRGASGARYPGAPPGAVC